MKDFMIDYETWGTGAFALPVRVALMEFDIERVNTFEELTLLPIIVQ